jgi:hypothetical protein
MRRGVSETLRECVFDARQYLDAQMITDDVFMYKFSFLYAAHAQLTDEIFRDLCMLLSAAKRARASECEMREGRRMEISASIMYAAV